MKALKRLAVVLLALAAALALIAWLVFKLPAFGGTFEGQRLERMRQSKQFINGRFENTPPYISDLSLLGELKAYLGDQVREPTFEIAALERTAGPNP